VGWAGASGSAQTAGGWCVGTKTGGDVARRGGDGVRERVGGVSGWVGKGTRTGEVMVGIPLCLASVH